MTNDSQMIGELSLGLHAQMIVTMALARVLIDRAAPGAPTATRDQLLDAIHAAIDGYELPEGHAVTAEEARARARLQVDAWFAVGLGR